MFHQEPNAEYHIDIQGKKENRIVFKAKKDGFNRDGAPPPPIELTEVYQSTDKKEFSKTRRNKSKRTLTSGKSQQQDKKKNKLRKKWIAKEQKEIPNLQKQTAIIDKKETPASEALPEQNNGKKTTKKTLAKTRQRKKRSQIHGTREGKRDSQQKKTQEEKQNKTEESQKENQTESNTRTKATQKLTEETKVTGKRLHGNREQSNQTDTEYSQGKGRQKLITEFLIPSSQKSQTQTEQEKLGINEEVIESPQGTETEEEEGNKLENTSNPLKGTNEQQQEQQEKI